jgi:hypothetical protein
MRARSFRRLLGWVALVALLGLAAACASGGEDGDVPESGGALPDSAASGDGMTLSDGSTGSDAGRDGPRLGSDSGNDSGLDAGLDAENKSDSTSHEGGADTGSVDSGTKDSATEDSEAMDSGVIDGSHDSGPADSGVKETAPPDTGPPDTGSSCVPVTLNDGANDGGACPAPVTMSCGMGDVAGFSPTWIPPSGYHQGLCTATEIDDIYDDCLASGATTASCDAEASAAPNCYDCVFSFESSSPSSYGPIIDTSNGVLEINVAGCIALLEPCNSTCAEEVQGALECENAACETNCPVTGTITLDSFDECEETAASCDPHGCDTFATEANCESELTGAAHPASVCWNQPSFVDYYDSIVPLFCGP